MFNRSGWQALGISIFVISSYTFNSLVASVGEVKLLVKNALIIPIDGSGTYIEEGYLAVGLDGKIIEVGQGAVPERYLEVDAIDVSGKFVMPGFLSGHSHLYQSPFRGLGAHNTLLGWIYCYHMTYGPYYDATDLYWFSKHGAMDYLGHGITTIYDWTLNSGWTTDQYTDLFRGSLDSGARILFGYGADSNKTLEENRDMLKEYLAIIKDEGIDASHPRVPAVWMAGLGLLNGREKSIMEFTLSREFDLPMQVHYLEEPDPPYVEIQRELFPLYDEMEMMGSQLNFAHFINVTEPILERTGESGTSMVWNPLSNGRLASGLPDIPHYRSCGIEVGMGIDGQASADVSDPFENMRLGMYAIRMKYQNAEVMMPLDVLRYHTIGTARVLGIDDQVGSLEVGKWADFIIVDPRDMETSPPIHPIEHAVLTCSVANLESVYIAGEKVVERGTFLQVDHGEVMSEVDWRLERIREKIAVAREEETLDRGIIFPGLDEYQQGTFIDDLEHPRYGRPAQLAPCCEDE
ncbi:MAG: amidohydrolase family protein [Verrucomicrobiota bacterium]